MCVRAYAYTCLITIIVAHIVTILDANVKCASDTELAAARDDIARLVDEHDKECKELIEKIVELQEAQDRIPPTLNLESTGVQTAKTITTQYQDIDTQTDIRATMGQQLSIADLLSSSRERLLKQPAPLLPLPSMHAPALFDPTTHYPVDVMTAADESHRKIQDLKRLSLALLKDE